MSELETSATIKTISYNGEDVRLTISKDGTTVRKDSMVLTINGPGSTQSACIEIPDLLRAINYVFPDSIKLPRTSRTFQSDEEWSNDWKAESARFTALHNIPSRIGDSLRRAGSIWDDGDYSCEYLGKARIPFEDAIGPIARGDIEVPNLGAKSRMILKEALANEPN